MLTFRKLQELFAAEYAINSAGGQGIMFGRYKGDSYVSGGAYYFSTFGAAEYYYRLARTDPDHRAALIERGDATLSRIREFIPASGCLSEQFDQTTGEQTSAKDLSWSYACFITAWYARQMALGQKGWYDAAQLTPLTCPSPLGEGRQRPSTGTQRPAPWRRGTG